MQREHLPGVRSGHKLDGHLIQRAVTDDGRNTPACAPRRRRGVNSNIIIVAEWKWFALHTRSANSSQNILNNLIMCVSNVVPNGVHPKITS